MVLLSTESNLKAGYVNFRNILINWLQTTASSNVTYIQSFRRGCLQHIRSPYLENSTSLSVAVYVSLSQA